MQIDKTQMNFMTCELHFNTVLIKFILTKVQLRGRDYNQKEAGVAILLYKVDFKTGSTANDKEYHQRVKRGSIDPEDGTAPIPVA